MFVRTWADRGTYCSITHSSEELKTAQMCPAGEWMNAQDIAQPWIMAEWSVVGNRVSRRPRWPWSPPVVLFLLLRSTTIGLYCHALAKIDFYLLHSGPFIHEGQTDGSQSKGAVTKPSDLSLIPGFRQWKESQLLQLLKVVLWLHMCTVAHMHMDTK